MWCCEKRRPAEPGVVQGQSRRGDDEVDQPPPRRFPSSQFLSPPRCGGGGGGARIAGVVTWGGGGAWNSGLGAGAVDGADIVPTGRYSFRGKLLLGRNSCAGGLGR